MYKAYVIPFLRVIEAAPKSRRMHAKSEKEGLRQKGNFFACSFSFIVAAASDATACRLLLRRLNSLFFSFDTCLTMEFTQPTDENS